MQVQKDRQKTILLHLVTSTYLEQPKISEGSYNARLLGKRRKSLKGIISFAQ